MKRDPFAPYSRPVRVVERGQTYHKYRRGGYNPADGTYGRTIGWGSSRALIESMKKRA